MLGKAVEIDERYRVIDEATGAELSEALSVDAA
jgi:hypothetical protein